MEDKEMRRPGTDEERERRVPAADDADVEAHRRVLGANDEDSDTPDVEGHRRVPGRSEL